MTQSAGRVSSGGSDRTYASTEGNARRRMYSCFQFSMKGFRGGEAIRRLSRAGTVTARVSLSVRYENATISFLFVISDLSNGSRR
jgi:hypothetical protein